MGLIKYTSFVTFGALIVCQNLAATETLPLGTSPKDAMFAQEKPYIICKDPIKVPACSDLCTEMKINYDEMKNINGRDIIPAQGLAKYEWYDLNGLNQHKIVISTEAPYKATEVKKKTPGGMYLWQEVGDADVLQANESPTQLTTYEVGKTENKSCKWATVWVHGATPVRGGLGVVDNIFGGSFNRMKRLAQNNDGMYYSPTIQDFGDDSGLAALVKYIRTKSCPKGKILLNCGSAGTVTCWKLAANKSVNKEISGMVLIGSGDPPADFETSDLAKARVPVLFTQGEHDHPEPLQKFVEKIHQKDPSYPIRFVLFKDGGHMTPLRMLDWRATANCMLTQAPPLPSDKPGPRVLEVNSGSAVRDP